MTWSQKWQGRERKELVIAHTQSVRYQLQKAVIEMIMRILMPRFHQEKMVEMNLIDQHTRKRVDPTIILT
jgi:hypothetical protein